MSTGVGDAASGADLQRQLAGSGQVAGLGKRAGKLEGDLDMDMLQPLSNWIAFQRDCKYEK